MSENVIIAFVTGVLGPTIAIGTKYILDRRKNSSKDLIKETLEIGSLVTTKLDTLKEELHADRIYIAQFHNGGHFYPTGKSIAKFSIVYETVSQDTASIQSNFQGIPVNLFSKSMNHLLDEDIIAIADFKDESIATYGLKYIASELGCKSSYLFAIKSIDGKFIGILGLDYTTRKTKLTEEQLNNIFAQASSIGGVLMTHLNK